MAYLNLNITLDGKRYYTVNSGYVKIQGGGGRKKFEISSFVVILIIIARRFQLNSRYEQYEISKFVIIRMNCKYSIL